MNMSSALSSFTAALEETKGELNQVNEQIAEIEREEHAVRTKPPHTTDILDMFYAGLSEAERTFKQQLSYYLNDRNLPSGAAKVAGSAVQLVTLPKEPPESPSLRPPGPLTGPMATLNVAAIVFLLQDRIAQEIPRLVEILCPGAADGMPQAERNLVLAGLAARKEKLKARADALVGEINAARAVLNPRQG